MEQVRSRLYAIDLEIHELMEELDAIDHTTDIHNPRRHVLIKMISALRHEENSLVKRLPIDMLSLNGTF